MISFKKKLKKLNKLFNKETNIKLFVNEYENLVCLKYNGVINPTILETLVTKLLKSNFKVIGYCWDSTYLILELDFEKKSEIIKKYFEDEKYRQLFTNLFSKDVTYLFC